MNIVDNNTIKFNLTWLQTCQWNPGPRYDLVCSKKGHQWWNRLHFMNGIITVRYS